MWHSSTSVKQSIYITGYPRSGNTWLGRLLSDVLGCGYTDGTGTDWPGDKTDAPYLVRKTHAVDGLPPDRTVFIYRDPRDVAVSIAHYTQGGDLNRAIIGMTKPDEKFGVCKYQAFMDAWWNTHAAAVEIRYCHLHESPYRTLRGIVALLAGYVPSDAAIQTAVHRQSLIEAQRRYHDTHHIRHGIVGEWRSFFDYGTAQLFDRYFGQMLHDQGFESDPLWYEIFNTQAVMA